MDYQDLHWGDVPTWISETAVLMEGAQYAVATSIAYVTTKAGKPEVFEHRFERRAWLYACAELADGPIVHCGPPVEILTDQPLEIGRLIDLRLRGGGCIIDPAARVCCSRDGLWLFLAYDAAIGTLTRPRLQLAHKSGAVVVEEAGIVL